MTRYIPKPTETEKAAATVHLMWYRTKESEEADMFIGVYASEENANDAISRLKNQPGFRDYPEGFEIYSYELDKDHWRKGFKYVDPKTCEGLEETG